MAWDTLSPSGNNSVEYVLRNWVPYYFPDTTVIVNGEDYPNGIDSDLAIHRLLAGNVDLAITTRPPFSSDEFAGQMFSVGQIWVMPLGWSPFQRPVYALFVKGFAVPIAGRVTDNWARATDALNTLANMSDKAGPTPSGRFLGVGSLSRLRAYS
jgi:hypothetical protein